jgi:hypothetical protein
VHSFVGMSLAALEHELHFGYITSATIGGHRRMSWTRS